MDWDNFFRYWLSFFRRKIREIPRKKPSELVSIASGIVVPAALAYLSVTDKFAVVLSKSVSIVKDGNQIEAEININRYLVGFIVFVFFSAIFTAFGSLFSKTIAVRKYKKTLNSVRASNSTKIRELRKLRGAYDYVCSQAAMVRHQSTDQPLNYNFTKHHTIYDINELGDLEVTKDIEIQAGSEYVKNWLLFIDGFPHAIDTDVFSDINLHVTCSDDNSCAMIPIVDDRKRKEVLIFFLPEIEPQKRRTMRISYKWPRMFHGLKDGSEQLFWSNSGLHRNRTTDFRSELRISRTLGKIKAEVMGPRPAGTALNTTHDHEKTIIEYAVPNMPCDSATYRLVLKIF